MAHEILSVKLCQLDDRVGRLHSRIHMSETAGHSQLRQEIVALEQEYTEAGYALQENLQHSRSALASILAQSYGQMEQIIQEAKGHLQALAQDNPDTQATVEGKLLLAEYALDFAHQAADRALLLSMEAIDAQLLQQQEGRTL